MKESISFALLFLIASIILSIALVPIAWLPGHEYFNPIGQLPLFGPTVTALLFTVIGKGQAFSNIGLNKFEIRPLLYCILMLVTLFIIERLLDLLFGFAEFKTSIEGRSFFNHQFSPVISFFMFWIFTTIFSGFGEEFAWRGYLFNKFKNLSWVQLVLLINIIWALWHLPMFVGPFSSYKGNALIKFPIFIIECLELGTILLYLRVKTKSVIPCMILHAIPNVFLSNQFLIIQNIQWAEFPNIINVGVILPFSIFLYFKGKKLYKKVD